MLTTGSLVCGYRIERLLGSGGMGAMYLAADPNLPRQTALKLLSAELSRDPDFRALLVAEHHEHGGECVEPINMNERLLTEQMRMLETLRAAYDDYRGILTAAASLTSSLQSIRIARAAIWVAMGSLGVAAVWLLITDISKHSIFGMVAGWLGLLH